MKIIQEQKNVVQYIREHGIKQSFLCEASGIQASRLSKIMNFVAEMSNDEYLIICELLGKDPNFFWERRFNK